MRLLKIATIIVVNALILLLILIGVELMLSKKSPLNGYIDNVHYTWGHVVKTNSLGFRERDFLSPKPDNTFRIMLVGDSLTFGEGLGLSERYSAVTESLLTEAFPHVTIEVLNFGVNGVSTAHEYEIINTHINDVDPDLIVIGFYYNDLMIKPSEYSQEKELIDQTVMGKAIQGLINTLSSIGAKGLSSMVNQIYTDILIRLEITPDYLTVLKRHYQPSSTHWDLFKTSLTKILTISNEQHLPTPIFSVLNDGYLDYTNPKNTWISGLQILENQAETLAQSLGYTTYNHISDISNWVKTHAITDDAHFVIGPYDAHPSASMNRLYGQTLANVIMAHYSQEILRFNRKTRHTHSSEPLSDRD